jgi:hypothetical protein
VHVIYIYIYIYIKKLRKSRKRRKKKQKSWDAFTSHSRGLLKKAKEVLVMVEEAAMPKERD